jgi:hypothetical protein
MRLIFLCCFAALMAPLPASAQHAPPPAPPSPPVVSVGPATVAPADLTWRRYPRTQEVRLQNVAAYVRVRPEDRDDVAVAIFNQGPLAAPRVRASGRRLVIDGQQRGQLQTCTVRGATGFETRTRRQGRVAGAQLPVIELRVPLDAAINASGAVRMHVTGAENVSIGLDGCGDVEIGRVAETATLAAGGYADIRITDVGELVAAVAGRAGIDARIVRDGLTVSVAGSGAFNAARADGPTNIVVQGSGSAAIGDGRADEMTVVINGSGQVTHRGSAESLDALIVGSGQVRVRDVAGETSSRVFGSGAVVVDR